MSPAGGLFYDFYGPNAFRPASPISHAGLGSLLDTRVRTRGREFYIAKYFQHRRSYIVTSSTSTASKIVGMYSAPAGSTVLVDQLPQVAHT